MAPETQAFFGAVLGGFLASLVIGIDLRREVASLRSWAERVSTKLEIDPPERTK